jgi:ferredoxin--NADP+ reductase
MMEFDSVRYYMNKIVAKEKLSPEVFRMVFSAPEIARARKAGQFVILQLGGDYNERFPLTIADASTKDGTVTIIFQTVGESTHNLARLNVGDSIPNVLGPLGRPSDTEKVGKVVCVGGGVGIAALYPIVQEMKQNGNEVKVIIGARTKALLIYEEEMRAVADELIVVTDDGSYGRKGLVTEPLKELCESWKPDEAFVVGPPVMMKFCALTTKPYEVKTYASLNTIMVDGTGMCGSCRVTYNGHTKFVCVDGPDFDAHKVDWDNLLARLGTFKPEEAEKHHKCHLTLGIPEGEA